MPFSVLSLFPASSLVSSGLSLGAVCIFFNFEGVPGVFQGSSWEFLGFRGDSGMGGGGSGDSGGSKGIGMGGSWFYRHPA